MSRFWEKLASWSLREWIASWLTARGRPSYAAAYRLLENAKPVDFKSYSGLIATSHLDDAEGKYLITYWLSKGSFEDSIHLLDADDSKELMWAHYVRETSVPKQPISDKVKPYQIFIHVAALGGAFLTLGTCWSAVSQKPNVLVDFQVADLNQLAQSDGEVALVVSNVSGEVKTIVEDLQLSVLDHKGQVVAGPLEGSLSSFTLIAGRDVELGFDVPPLEAGEYELVADLTMNSGFLRGSQTPDFSATYGVWSRAPNVKKLKIERVDSFEYILRSELAVGTSQSVLCQATLVNIPVEDVLLAFPGTADWEEKKSDDGDVLVIKWSANSMRAFRWMPFALRVRTGEELLIEDLKNAQVDCQEESA